VKGTAPGKAPAETRGVTRIMFPITLPVHVTEINQAKNQYMLSCLHVLSGHIYIYSWYLAMYEALDAGFLQDVSLWQCCLTATLHVRVGMSLTELAVLSIQQRDTMPCMMCSLSFFLAVCTFALFGGGQILITQCEV
jgi:hypothetical protein